MGRPVSRQGVSQYIAELVKLGYIEQRRQTREGKGEVASLYRVIMDGELPAEFDRELTTPANPELAPPANPELARTSQRTTQGTSQVNVGETRPRATPPVNTETDTHTSNLSVPLVDVPKATKTIKKAQAQEPIPTAPDWLPAETWQAFIDHRIAKHIPMTASNAAMTLKQLDKARGFGHDPVTLIETAIASNWTGCVFPNRHYQPALIHDQATPAPHNGKNRSVTQHDQLVESNRQAMEVWLASHNANVIEGECHEIH